MVGWHYWQPPRTKAMTQLMVELICDPARFKRSEKWTLICTGLPNIVVEIAITINVLNVGCRDLNLSC